jgi:hypothetical protein
MPSGIGSIEQISGAIEQIPGRGQSYSKDIGVGCVFLVLPQPIEALAKSGGWGLSFRADGTVSALILKTHKPKMAC